MLDLAADTAGDINLRMDGHTSLTDLAVMVAETCVNGGAAGANLSVKNLRKLEEHVETFLAAHSVTSGNNDGSSLEVMLGLLHMVVEDFHDVCLR